MKITPNGLVVTRQDLTEPLALVALDLITEEQANGIINGGGLADWALQSPDDEVLILESLDDKRYILVGSIDGASIEDGNGAPMNSEGFYQFG